MGYVFSFADAQDYEEWFGKESSRLAIAIEKETLQRVWSPPPGKEVLEVGCGTGIFLQWFLEQGHQVTGLDASPYMLNLAEKRLPSRVMLERGYGEDLPFSDNSFDTVAIINTLEFAESPLLVLQEACRVAREQVLLGVLNKYSLLTWQHCVSLLWRNSVYRYARFFSLFELNHMVEKALSGPIPTNWRTCLSFPLYHTRLIRTLEHSGYFQWHPFGHFIAMSIDMCYNLRTLQQPLLSKVASPARPSHPHVACWPLPFHEKPAHYRPHTELP